MSLLLDGRSTCTFVIMCSPQTSFVFVNAIWNTHSCYRDISSKLQSVWSNIIHKRRSLEWRCKWGADRMKLYVESVGRDRNCLIQAEAHFKPSQGRFHPVLMSQQHQTKSKEKYTFTDTTSTNYCPLRLLLKQINRWYSLHYIRS